MPFDKKLYVKIFFLVAIYFFFFGYARKGAIIVKERVPRDQTPFTRRKLSLCIGIYFSNMILVISENFIIRIYPREKLIY